MTVALTDIPVNHTADYKVRAYKDSSTGSTTQVVVLGRLDSGAIVPFTDADPMPVAGNISASFSPVAESAVTTQALISVADSSTSVLASNANRTMAWVKNISTQTLYVSLSGTAATNKPTKLLAGESLALGNGTWVYTGAVSAIHADTGNTHSLEVVEL